LLQGHALFPLANPGIVSIPLGFLGAIIGTLLSPERDDAKFDEILVKANTGIHHSPPVLEEEMLAK